MQSKTVSVRTSARLKRQRASPARRAGRTRVMSPPGGSTGSVTRHHVILPVKRLLGEERASERVSPARAEG